MKKKLYAKFILGYVVYGMIAFLVLCTVTQSLTTKQSRKNEAQALYRESTLMASDYAANYFNSEVTLEDVQSQIEAVSKYLSAEIWVMDTNGNLLLNSQDASVAARATEGEYLQLADFDISHFGNAFYQTGDFYGHFNKDVLSVFSTITINYKVRGYVLIHKPLEIIDHTANGYININFLAVSIIVIIALVMILLLAYFVYRPLMKISQVAKMYAKGNFDQRIEVHSQDEIGYLANTMNYMAEELNTLEEDQRKFVSNVSHDFRSPLTSIKGYIEAMLDGTIPVEMQEKYLKIILFETERLNKLTQNILDLNQFGHRGMRLDIADFDINRMIRTTIRTFEGTCGKKGLTFDLFLTGKELFVTADMIKIQQVLYNLIDNATKFSNTNTAIKIETNIRNEKVLISVKDSGIGIPADSIKKIWERFYKTDLSRGKDKKGTGLGLAIVREIIQAHDEHINVVSTEGVGTEFIFTLPLSKKDE